VAGTQSRSLYMLDMLHPFLLAVAQPTSGEKRRKRERSEEKDKVFTE